MLWAWTFRLRVGIRWLGLGEFGGGDLHGFEAGRVLLVPLLHGMVLLFWGSIA